MGVSARNNSMGSFEYREPFEHKHVRKVFSKDITEVSSSGFIRTVHGCGREGISNPRKTVPGTEVPWRDPSPYKRTVINHDRSEGIWESFEPDYYNADIRVPLDDWDKWINNPVAFSPDVIWADHLEYEAIAKATAKIKDEEVGLGEDLATYSQTYRMVAENSLMLLDAVKAARRKDIPGVAKALRGEGGLIKQGANYFLQYQYGWKPLMSDIHGGVKLIREATKPVKFITGKSKSFKEYVYPSSSLFFERNVSGPTYRQCYCKLYARLDDVYRHAGDQLGLSNPLSLAWELVPWSFVVDWFIPVGNVLDAWSAPCGVTFVGGFSTMRGEYDVRMREIPTGLYQETSPRTSHLQIFSMERRVYTSWPKPGFYAVNPFGPEHSKSLGQRGENSFALLLQKILRT